MRKHFRFVFGGVITAALGLLVAVPALAGGEIYGTIHTTDGDAYTGPIRWDVNENFWDDELNAMKRERIKREDAGTRSASSASGSARTTATSSTPSPCRSGTSSGSTATATTSWSG